MTASPMPPVPYGAVYFRKSNPPKQDWERDYAVAAEDGHNIFRHWFMWSAIETRPGVFDWDDYDRQFELAEKYGIKTIIAEMITATPEWLYHQRPEGRYVNAEGKPLGPHMGASSTTGGFHGMSLDDAVVREAAGNFLTKLVERYRDHPAMTGYDVWNECNYIPDTGFTPATLEAFRDWLKAKYGDIETLERAWGRHSMWKWEYVLPPHRIEAYADSLDWLAFQRDNAFSQLRWRIDLIRKLDTRNLVTTHGVAASIVATADRGSDDWRSAEDVDVYGFTWANSRQGDKPWQHLQSVDLTRASARGKPFWHAEAQGGPLWLQPQVIGRPLNDGRVTSASDLRLWNMTSLAAGARGILFPRWRPLLDGPLFGAFGPYAMDGSRTDRSDTAASIAKWANAPAQADLWRAQPVQGEIGLVFVPETQDMDYALQGRNGDQDIFRQARVRTYTRAIRGVYEGFFENNIQADFVHIDDIESYKAVYLPYPIMMSQETADKLAAYVAAGGVLICEGLPGYFDARGRVGEVQPSLGLDAVFGTREADVVFAPDLFDDLTLDVLDYKIFGGAFLQSYAPTTGRAVGTFEDGAIAAVENAHGAGRTLLIGSFPGIGFATHHSEGGRAFFRHLLDWAGLEPLVRTSNRSVTARLQSGEGGDYLWLLNATRTAQTTRLSLSGRSRPLGGAQVIWGEDDAARVENGEVVATVGARDALVVRIT